MISPKKMEELAQQLGGVLPEGLKSAADEFESKAKTILQHQLGRLDVVTREEFDRQAAVLAKTRAMVEAMEVRLEALEQSKREQQD